MTNVARIHRSVNSDDRPPDCSQGFVRSIEYDDGTGLEIWCVDHSRWRCLACRAIRRWEELAWTILPGVTAARELYFDFDPNTHNLKITKLRRKKKGTPGAYALLWVEGHPEAQRVALSTFPYRATVPVAPAEREALARELAGNLVQPQADAQTVSVSHGWGIPEGATINEAPDGTPAAGEPEPDERSRIPRADERPAREIICSESVRGVAWEAYRRRAADIAKDLPAEVRPIVHVRQLRNRDRAEGGSTVALAIKFPDAADWRTKHRFYKALRGGR